MSDEAFRKAGLNIDELNNIRLLDPDIFQQSSELKDACKEFTDKIESFHKIVASVIAVVDNVAKEVEKEKMKAIGSRNMLKSITKQREAEQMQLLALITEKTMQLERLRIQHEALLKQERDQNEFIEQLMLEK
ncbi:Hypothetical predicted protein [Octopus vulgaris]|uniref:Uncharacterized protein n=3 Tax=Octopus TaxID=6643 RepID=A0AA36BVQ4_OCTVU|nr:intraflagellar transport protein 20 homolog [Octopus bimaculoides]XP_029651195.1 intraflagellar transport protein 20 homolog [Octopus sinensis]CAI9740642.1 Hypothetical predicted protein [Octopus vulgaris]|eukprot:XP_014775531.1 PREDICTED: intraflagellar transport protein 20 homolog [Octopus bimaculoides]